jgi:hypothetical protein
LGQIDAVVSRQFALAWEALEASYDALDRDRAEGEALDALGKLTGTPRPVATKSEVFLLCDLDAGTTLLAGVHFASVDGEPDNRWTPKEDVGPVPITTQYSIEFEAEFAGSKVANTGTITVIDTGPVGWTAVTNSADAEPGREVATDAEYRTAQDADVNRAGSTSAKAIETDLRALQVDGARPIISARVIENDTDIDGINGLPRHTIEAVIHDSPDVDNDLIAQTIHDQKAAGIGTYGQIQALATLTNGETKATFFSRAVVREVYLEYTLDKSTGYVGDTAFKNEVVLRLQGKHKVGTDVTAWNAQLAASQEGVDNASVKLGFAPSPTLEDDLPITEREIADFDASRITIV